MIIKFRGRPITKARLGWWLRIALTRLFGTQVKVEGRDKPLRIFPWIYNGKLMLMGAEQEFLQVYFTNQYTAALRTAPCIPKPDRVKNIRPIQRIVHVVLCHQEAKITEAIYQHHKSVSDYSIFVAYGGTSNEFEKISADKYFLEDPTLRGPAHLMSHFEMVRRIFDNLGDDSADTFYFFTESDLLPVTQDYLRGVIDAIQEYDADFCGKSIRDITMSSNGFLARGVTAGIAGPTAGSSEICNRRYYHCLGCFFGIRGNYLKAFAEDCKKMKGLYFEVMFPTAAEAVGAKMLSLNSCGKLMSHVRYRPEYLAHELEEVINAGANMVHPVKKDALNYYFTSIRNKKAG